MDRNPEDVIKLCMEDLPTNEIAEKTGYSKRHVRRIRQAVRNEVDKIEEEEDTSLEKAELLVEIAKLNKQIQARDDKLRVMRQERRTNYRYDNALEEYVKTLCNELDKNPPKTKDISKFNIKQDCVGIFQLSDPHFNELIELPFNTYDFHIASKRLRKFVKKAINYFLINGVTKIWYAMTGDLINSSRRLEELLCRSTNRTRATLLAAELIEYSLMELNKYFVIEVAYVTGNESRVEKEVTYADVAVSDNYDTMIYELLKRRFRLSNSVLFHNQDSVTEYVINVAGRNILLMHGYSLSQQGLGAAINKVKGKYASRGILIDYVIFGHYHDSNVSDWYARSSSMCGANTYSDEGLQLNGRASQLIHVVDKNDFIDTFKIDLQDVNDIEGYDLTESLIAYNAKSASKVFKRKTI